MAVNSETNLDSQGFGDIDKVTDSMVFRIEHLLAGKSFEQMQEVANKLYDEYNDYFQERINIMEDWLASLPPKEEDKEYLEYLENLKILSAPVQALSIFDKLKILQLFNSAVNSIDNNMKRLDIIPSNRISIEETFDRDAVNSEYLIQSLQKRLELVMEEPHRVFVEKKVETYKNQIKQNLISKNERFCLAVSKNVLFEKFDETVEILKYIKSLGRRVELVVDNLGGENQNSFETRVPYSYTAEEMDKLFKLYRCDEYVDEMYFSEFFNETFMPMSREKLWNFDQIEFANVIKNEFIKDIKSLDLSPIQKVLCIHKFVSRVKYTGRATSDEKTRTFLMAEHTVNKDGQNKVEQAGYALVCTGIAEYAKALLDEFGDKNVGCKLIRMNYYSEYDFSKRLSGSHMGILVYLNDEKYGYNGYYICDPTSNIESGAFSDCLIPISEIDKFLDGIMVVDEGNEMPFDAFLLTHNRKDKLEKRWNNGRFETKYFEGKPISFKTFKNAIKDMYDKIQNSPKPIITYENINKLDTIDMTIADINETFHDLDRYNPETSQNAFYRKLRDFYLMHMDEGLEDWIDCWNDYNLTIEYTREDWQKEL